MNRDEALQEYFFTQDKVDSIDEKTLRFKEWNITIASGSIGAALFEGNSKIALLAVLSSFCFWLMEGWWKQKQRVFEKRAYTIENLLRANEENIDGPAISASFHSLYEPENRAKKYYFISHCNTYMKRDWFPARLLHLSVLFLPFLISASGIIAYLIISSPSRPTP